jgi:transcription elongation factor Elf1
MHNYTFEIKVLKAENGCVCIRFLHKIPKKANGKSIGYNQLDDYETLIIYQGYIGKPSLLQRLYGVNQEERVDKIFKKAVKVIDKYIEKLEVAELAAEKLRKEFIIEKEKPMEVEKKETCPICGSHKGNINCLDIGDEWGEEHFGTCGECPVGLSRAFVDTWRKDRQERLKGQETVKEYYDRQRREIEQRRETK